MLDIDRNERSIDKKSNSIDRESDHCPTAPEPGMLPMLLQLLPELIWNVGSTWFKFKLA